MLEFLNNLASRGSKGADKPFNTIPRLSNDMVTSAKTNFTAYSAVLHILQLH